MVFFYYASYRIEERVLQKRSVRGPRRELKSVWKTSIGDPTAACKTLQSTIIGRSIRFSRNYEFRVAAVPVNERVRWGVKYMRAFAQLSERIISEGEPLLSKGEPFESFFGFFSASIVTRAPRSYSVHSVPRVYRGSGTPTATGQPRTCSHVYTPQCIIPPIINFSEPAGFSRQYAIVLPRPTAPPPPRCYASRYIRV